MKVVGLTGGIGSGKSTVARIFEILGVPVYYSDLAARRLSDSHPVIVSGIQTLFGKDIYVNGKLDRRRVAGLVFNNKTLLDALNGIVHPVVMCDFDEWKTRFSSCPFVVKEVAILFEIGAELLVDQVVLVTAPEELRVKRVVQRDGITPREVIERMKHQLPDSTKIEKSNYVITCDEKHLVFPQVFQFYQLFV